MSFLSYQSKKMNKLFERWEHNIFGGIYAQDFLALPYVLRNKQENLLAMTKSFKFEW